MYSTVNTVLVTRGGAAGYALVALLLVGAHAADAQTETVLYNFGGAPGDGGTPARDTPVFDKQGNLYGVTVFGGMYDLGTVYKISPSGTETVLWNFGNGTDGAEPTGVILDKLGSLYGTTAAGGAYNLGTAWKLTPSGTESVLWSFGNGTDGSDPEGTGPVMDSNGNLYGTTLTGGAYGLGTTWELTPAGTETVRWSFGNGTDGNGPEGLVIDKAGNLFGVTYYGGIYGHGTVYGGTVWELSASGTETVLYSFDEAKGDGYYPIGAPVMDKNGNLYGTCHVGGQHKGVFADGTVWKLTQSGTEKILLYADTPGPNDLYAGVTLDKKGNIYSAGAFGGTYNLGAIFKLTPKGKETTLYSFGSTATDGTFPSAGLAVDKKGNVYGATDRGGANTCQVEGTAQGCGTVFKIAPQ